MDSKGRQYHIIVEKHDKDNSKDITELDLCDYFRKNDDVYKFWAFILHDKDLGIDGVLEREHYHIIVSMDSSKCKTTIINDIVRNLMINPNCIGVRIVKDIVKSVQYLIHQNDKEKYQYDLLDIWTNDVNEMMSCILNSVSSYEVDIEYLIKLTSNCKSLKQVYRQLGLQKSKEYRSLICDLWKERFRD